MYNMVLFIYTHLFIYELVIDTANTTGLSSSSGSSLSDSGTVSKQAVQGIYSLYLF